MSETRYGNLVKSLPFKDFAEGGFRQGSEMTSQWLNLPVNIRYGTYWMGGKMGSGQDQPHVHDYDQVLIWFGADMTDLGELGAEIELTLGEDLETQMITVSTAVAIPRGMPHFPATIQRMDKRFFYMEISIAAQCSETVYVTDKKPVLASGFRTKYGKYISALSFRRKGAWYYGPTNRDDGGGSIAFVRTQEMGFDFVMLYENMKKAPYRLCPEPEKPHAHPTTQIMLFLGTDPEDISQFNAEFEICMGKELEKHVFTQPTAVITPPFLPHWPGGLVKAKKPILMCDIHPFGNDH
ncbi:MAG TPA: hypothetical protein VLH15_09155 [Dehalococcoidales bacterium]|nr:hypothetical protein [Dehalococcoidales bacterium]